MHDHADSGLNSRGNYVLEIGCRNKSNGVAHAYLVFSLHTNGLLNHVEEHIARLRKHLSLLTSAGVTGRLDIASLRSSRVEAA